jgi:eukaryotic-like serine/threonine-protein kinase
VSNNDSEDITRSYHQLARDTLIGHYRIIERIGAGGMGEVYLAEDTKLDRKVALKFLPSHLCQNADCRARFKREAQAAAKLGHSNIVAVYEVGEHHGRPFFAMELVEGRSLDKIIAGDQLSENQIVELALGICNGLRKAHESGVIHRDIKPSNIIVDCDNVPRVLDFGLAAVRDSDSITHTAATMGTVGYMSPEQVAGRSADARSDLFSLGVVLYEMAAGSNPFRRDNQAATLKAICDDRPGPIVHRGTDISPGLERIITKLLEKKPEFRYQSAAEVAGELRVLAIPATDSEMKSLPGLSIAVLPFANLTPDPDQEYFCDGMTEEIINALSHVEGLQVVARTSALSFKGQAVDIREIGRRLGVRAVLEGSVRRSANRLRISTQLVDVASGYHMWSEKYDRDFQDVFAIQDEISLAVVDNLKVRLQAGEKARLVKRYTEDSAAYTLYLKGRFFWNKRTEDGTRRAISLFEQAFHADTGFAPAYAGLADCYLMLGYYDVLPPKEAFPTARAAAEKAIGLDHLLGEAHTSLASVKLYYDWDWPGAEMEFKKGIELNPGYSIAYQWYAEYLAFMGKFEEAIAMGKRSMELDPLSPIIASNLAGFYWIAGQYDTAIEEYRKALEMDSNLAVARIYLGLTYAATERYDEAISELQKGIALSGGENSPHQGILAAIYGVAGRRERGEQLLDRVIALSKDKYISPCQIATTYLGLGEKELALDWLDRAYAERDHWIVSVKVNPMVSGLRTDARFTQLLGRMGFPEH